MTISPAGERKLVTVLFADVTGSTELADRLDPEELREVMGAWFGVARAEVEAQGGRVEKYIGDAVMAVFGVPSAHEDDPARALRATLRLRERLASLNDDLAHTYGVKLEIRIGVNTGEAVTTADPAPGEAFVTGVAVNVAARLEQVAEPGQTVVAERTARAAPGFRFETLGALDLRGKEEPVPAVLLVEALPDAATRGLPGMHAPLVGRDRELDLLWSLYDRVVAERRPQLVTIYGDPGVGKSRLVRELLLRLAESGKPRAVVGRCLSYGEGIAYWPLAEVLKSLAGIDDADPAETALARLAALAGELPAEMRASSVAALAFTLGLDAGDDAFARLQPSAIRVELHRVWRTLLSTLAAREPLVVVVDDIHWADPVLLDLLEETAERAQGPLLFVCPARPELTGSRPTWGGGRRNFSSLALGPLSMESAGELVGELLDVDGLTAETRARILERGEGNPFFIEEILRKLIDEGRIVREAGRWKATEELPSLELPDTVQAVLAARIDLLEPSAKHALQQASVVGRIFWRGAVAALVRDEQAVDLDLRRLEERELVAARLTSSLAGEDELAFSHILTRDVAYESLPRRERPRAHARVASWIEETTGDRQREYAGLLAHHYAEAYRGAKGDRSYAPDELESLRRRALELLLQGARNATRGTAFAAARSLAESAHEIAATPEERADALLTLGVACRHAAAGDESWEAFAAGAEALLEAGAPDSARLALLCGLAGEAVCRWTGTMTRVPDEAAVARLLDAGFAATGADDSEAHVRLLTARSFWGHSFPTSTSPDRDPEAGARTAAEGAEMALRLGRDDLAVVALDGLQYNLQQLLRYEEAHEASRRRVELAQGAGDLSELGDALAVHAWNANYVGLFDEAKTIGRHGYEQLVRDAPYYAVHALSWAALASFFLGDWDDLLADVARIQTLLDEGALHLTSGFASPWPAAAYVREVRGERAESERLLDQIYALEGHRSRVSQNLSPELIRTLIHRGETPTARARVDKLAAQGGTQHNLSLFRLAEAELLLAEERWADLPALAAAARATHKTTGARFLAPLAARLEGVAAAKSGRPESAIPKLEAAVARFEELHMPLDAALARADLAEALYAAGRPDEADATAERSASTLTRLGYGRRAGV